MTGLRVVAGLLPFLICLWTWRVCALRTGEWRGSLALAAVVVGVTVGLGTELLSLLGAVHAPGVLVLYATFCSALVVASRRLRRAAQPPVSWRALRDPWVTFAAAISATLLALAIVSPPNNWDSMTYHMARVAHWAEQADVSYYATHIDRQLFLQPWAEYAILHTYVLSGSDLWANVVQWVSMAVSVVVITLVARNLGLGRRGQLAAGVIVLTLPMGITQSVTTQNDYVATMWIVVLAAFVTGRDAFRAASMEAVLVGSAAGLAAMTKATSYFFVAPLLLWWLLKKVDLKTDAVGKAVLAVAIPALLLTAPGFVRNIDTFARPLGPSLSEFVNDPIGPRALAENSVRHGALQFAVPIQSVNERTTQLVRDVSSSVGLDLDRAGSTFPPGHRFAVLFGNREDDAQAFAATALLVVAIPWLLIARPRTRGLELRSLALLVTCAVVGAVLLEGYFRWNPWNGRYLLPFFALTAVASAAVVERLPRLGYRLVLTALLASSLLWVLTADLRPVVRHDSVLLSEREDQYFAARQELREPYQLAAEHVRELGIRRVGYVGAIDDWEYPLWVLLNKDSQDISLESVNVQNASKEFEGSMPPVVVCTTACATPSTSDSWTVRRFGPLSVWERL